MERRAEHLPTEIWISIFHYFELHELFRAFNNLNSYFSGILTSNYLSFYLQLQKRDQFSSWSSVTLNRIISLKSSRGGEGKCLSQFLSWHGSKLVRLRSLTIEVHAREILSDCIEFLKCHSIVYLSLACIPNESLVEGILYSPRLSKCRLYFWRSTNNINLSLNINSDMKILQIRLKDNSNPSLINSLLSRLPKLKTLQIVGDHVQQDLSIFLEKSSMIFPRLQRMKLIWLRLHLTSDYFDRLLIRIPSVKYLYIGIYSSRLTSHFLENLIDHWWPSLVRIPFVKMIIRCRELSRSIENNDLILLNNYSRQISEALNTSTNVGLNIKWIEENAKVHSIKITIEKS